MVKKKTKQTVLDTKKQDCNYFLNNKEGNSSGRRGSVQAVLSKRNHLEKMVWRKESISSWISRALKKLTLK